MAEASVYRLDLNCNSDVNFASLTYYSNGVGHDLYRSFTSWSGFKNWGKLLSFVEFSVPV